MTTSDETLPELPQDVRALLDAEQRVAQADATWQPPEGMMARVAGRLPLDAPPPAPGSGPSGGGGPAGGLGSTGAVKGLLGAALVTGGLLGGGGMWMVQKATAVAPPQPVVVPVPVMVTPPAPEPVAVPEPKPRAPEPVQRPVDRSAERAILERARSALARREFQLTMDAVTEHRRKFPSSQLSEERDMLEIVALTAQGQVAPVKAKVDDFERRYPQSPNLPSLRKLAGGL